MRAKATESGIVIAEAVADDSEWLAALYEAVLPPGWPAEELAACCKDANRALLKAADGAQPHGFVILQFAADEAEILAIAVAKEKQGQGYATSLMQAAIDASLRRFVSCIYLEVAESNTRARKLYEKFGFFVIGKRENYYRSASSAPETALIMRLDAKLSGSMVDRERSDT